jgi:hypothetical protein
VRPKHVASLRAVTHNGRGRRRQCRRTPSGEEAAVLLSALSHYCFYYQPSYSFPIAKHPPKKQIKPASIAQPALNMGRQPLKTLSTCSPLLLNVSDPTHVSAALFLFQTLSGLSSWVRFSSSVLPRWSVPFGDHAPVGREGGHKLHTPYFYFVLHHEQAN